MAAITVNFGSGGANLTPNSSAGATYLATALRDIADDLAGIKPATIVTANAEGTWHQAEADLLNEMKTALNAIAAYTLKTTKA